LRPLGLRGRALLEEEGIAVGAAPFDIEDDPPPPEPTAAKADHRLHFAKQLVGYATTLPDAKIAKLAGVSVEAVASLRGANEA
jgi:hypothetical protein